MTRLEDFHHLQRIPFLVGGWLMSGDRSWDTRSVSAADFIKVARTQEPLPTSSVCSSVYLQCLISGSALRLVFLLLDSPLPTQSMYRANS